jgi:NAD+ synthase (glutamine-hydrolysing)
MSKDNKISLKITQASCNQTALDFPRNIANAYQAIKIASEEGSDLLCLEELLLTGYECNDDFEKIDNNLILQHLEDIAFYAKTMAPNLIISIGHPWRISKKDIPAKKGNQAERVKNPLYNRLDLPFNVQTLISNGKIQGMTAKSYLFNNERGYESRYFQEWSLMHANNAGGVYGTINIPLREGDSETIPFGRPLVAVQSNNSKEQFIIAHAICEEKWVASKYDSYPQDDNHYDKDNIIPSISRYLGSKKGLVLLVPNASPPKVNKIDQHIHLANLASRHYADLVVDTDGLGTSGATFAQYGHRLISQDGKLLYSGVRASFQRVAASTNVVHVSNASDKAIKKSHVKLKHKFKEHKAIAGMKKTDNSMSWDNPSNPDRHIEESIRNSILWMFDYMRKTGASGVAEALSGGKDSAFNSVLIRLMVQQGMQELGVKEFCNEIGCLTNVDDILDAEKTKGVKEAVRVCMKEILTCVYMGTDNSSEETRNAAQFLIEGGKDELGNQVEGIGGKYYERNVQDLLNFYAFTFAVKDTSSLKEQTKNKLFRDVSDFLNLKPGSISLQELALKELNIKSCYPDLHLGDLISAANPEHGLAYENIQASARQVLINQIAKVENKRSVANPNLNETIDGYTTFGGDEHAGVINLNSPYFKIDQEEAMEYLYKKGLNGVCGPIKALGPVMKNKPSAELQPKDQNGNVVQNDEDALFGTFSQLKQFAEYMLYKKIETSDGSRRLNASEVFQHCKKDNLFYNLNENELYNMVQFRYQRWGIAQHKIHAAPLGPTMGNNVDHQTSLRTPNISGNSKDELTLLGVNLLFEWANKEGLSWSQDDRVVYQKRALQDESFIDEFERHLHNEKSHLKFDLSNLYQKIKAKGWEAVFTPLNKHHPLTIVLSNRKNSNRIP